MLARRARSKEVLELSSLRALLEGSKISRKSLLTLNADELLAVPGTHT